ncbi:MAG: hypothetical protein WCF18_08100, partial [Chthoniobacteraceae bacterium]
SMAAAVAAAYGAGRSFAGGGADASATITDTTRAYTDLSTLSLAGNLNVNAVNTSTASTAVLATAASFGLISSAASGTVATSTVNPVVASYVKDTNVTAYDISILGRAIPKALSDAAGLTVSTGAAMGVSSATSTIGKQGTTPTVTTYIGGTGKTITANNLTVSAQHSLPTAGDTARAKAQGSAGGLLIGVSATLTTVSTTYDVASYVAAGTTLEIRNGASVLANTSSRQRAISSSAAVGLIAVGATKADATSDAKTNAYLGDNVKFTGAALTVTANGGDDNYSETTAGAGGVVGVAAAAPTTTTKSVTNATIGAATANRDINLTARGAGQLTVNALHTSTFNTRVITDSYGFLSGSGAIASNTVNSAVNAVVAASGGIRAKNIDIGADNRVEKPVLAGSADNIKGTTGGLAAAAGAVSTSTLTLDTTVNIGANASLVVDGQVSNAHLFKLHALNTINGTDSLTFTTAGALSGAAASTTFKTALDRATVNIGSGAHLYSSGALDLSARGTGNITATVSAETYGVATAAVGTSTVDIRPENRIIIASGVGTHIRAYGDLNLSAGRSSDADLAVSTDRYSLESRWDGVAGSAIPLSDVDAHSYLYTENTINVGTDALLQSARQANLYAAKEIVGSLIGKAKVASWASAVGEFLGGSGEGQFKAEILGESHGLVTMNGTVETGLTRHQTLDITSWDNTTGAITATASNGITYTTTIKQLESNLVQELHQNEATLAQFGSSNATLKAYYEGEVARIKAELAASGQSRDVTYTDSNGVSHTDTLYPSREVRAIIVNPIWAQPGRVEVNSDQLSGTGKFIAPSDSTVTITNATPFFLELKGINIPTVAQGLFYDGILVTDNAGVNTLNTSNAAGDNSIGFSGVDPTEVAAIATFAQLPTVATGTNEPVIEVKNTLNVNNYTDSTGAKYPWPDITIQSYADGGTGIFNDLGNVVLQTVASGTGSINILGPVRAKNLTIVAGGDVYVSGLSTFSVGGEAASLLGPATTGTYGAGAATAAGVVAANTSSAAFTTAVSNPAGILFSVTSLRDFDALVSRLKNPPAGDTLSSYLWSRIPAATKTAIEDTKRTSFQNEKALVDALNDIVMGETLWNAPIIYSTVTIFPGVTIQVPTAVGANGDRFIGFGISQATKDLAATSPTGINLAKLNNSLLQEAYQSFLSPTTSYNVFGDRIHIEAQDLNVNGIIQSGRDSYTLSINSAALSEATTLIGSGHAGRIYLENTSNKNPGFSVFFNTNEDRFEVDELKAGGGHVELFGQVHNTGAGEIRVLGGYASATINNTTSKNVYVQSLDVSQRGGGTLVINDKASGTPTVGTGNTIDTVATTGSNQNYTSIYQWNPTGVTLTTNGASSNTVHEGVVTSLSGYNSTYQPAAGWRYGWTTVVDQNVIKKKHTKSGSWAGFVPDVFQSDEISWDSIEVNGTPHYAGSGPFYYKFTTAAGDTSGATTATQDYSYKQTTVTTGRGPVVNVYHDDYWTWYGSHVYVNDYQAIDTQQVNNTHSVTASKSIAIKFIGATEGAITVNSNAGGNVIVGGPLLSGNGTTTVATTGAISATNDAYVGGSKIILTASSGIGTLTAPVRTDITDIAFKFDSSVTGASKLNTPDFSLESSAASATLAKYATVRVSDTHDTTKGKRGSVFRYIGTAASGVDLTAENFFNTAKWQEVIPTTQDVVKVAEKFYRYIGAPASITLSAATFTDTTKWAEVTTRPGLKAVTANGTVALEEIAGDLPVNEITSTGGGEISVNVPHGAVTVAHTDSATWAAGKVSGGRIGITADGGGIGSDTSHPLALDSGVGAGTTAVTGALDVTLNAKGDVFIKESSGDLLLNQLITTGNAWISVPTGSLIDANSTKVRDERTYNQLKAGVWGDLQLTNYTKDASGTLVYTGAADAKIAETIATFEAGKQSEYRTFWQFDANYDGTKVSLSDAEHDIYVDLYTSQGLTQTQIDAAITTLETARTTQYQVLKDQFTTYFGGTLPAAYDPNFHYTATTAKVNEIKASIKVWTEDELMSLAGSGLLKAVTSTRADAEAPNIVANNVTIIDSTGNVGRSAGQLSIALGGGHVLTDDEKVAIGAAERSDVTFVGGAAITTTVDFTASSGVTAGTIRRTDGLAWTGLSAGMGINLMGASLNANPDLAFYTIASISGDTITLVATDTVVAEPGKSITFLPLVLDPVFKAQGAAADVAVTFSYNGFGSDGLRQGDTITRTTGDWTADGYAVGSLIRVAGASGNVTDASSYYTVASVTPTVITLSTRDKVITESPAAAVTFTRGVKPTVTSLLIDQRDDVNFKTAGDITVTASGNVLLGSAPYQGQESPLNILQVSAGNSTTPGDVRIKSSDNIVNSAAAGVAAVVGGDLILESGQGKIGSNTKPFLTDLFANSTLTVRSLGDIYVSEHITHTTGSGAGDMNLESAYSESGTVHLEADGSILDALHTGQTKIKAGRIELVAGDTIGSAGTSGNPDFLEIDLVGSGTLTAVATNNIWIAETSGNLNVRDVLSTAGDVHLVAPISIFDGGDVADPTNPTFYNPSNPATEAPGAKANVVGNKITLVAKLGAIGAAGSELQVNTGYSTATSASTLDTTSADNTFVTETSGDLYLKTVTAGAGATAFVTNAVASIYNGNVGGDNAVSGKLWLFAANNIGTTLNPIATRSGNIKGEATNGSVYIENTGAVTIGGVTGGAAGAAPAGIKAGGAVRFEAHSPITVSQDVTSVGTIDIISGESADDTADFVRILTGIKLKTTGAGADINVLAGDAIDIDAGATLQAAGAILLRSDNAKADTAPAAITLTGASLIAGTSITVESTANFNALSGTKPDATVVKPSLSAGTGISITTSATGSVISLDATTLHAAGAIVTSSRGKFDAKALTSLTADGSISITTNDAGSAINVDHSTIGAGTTLTANSAGDFNATTGASLTSGGDMTIHADQGASIINVNASTLDATGSLLTTSKGKFEALAMSTVNADGSVSITTNTAG